MFTIECYELDDHKHPKRGRWKSYRLRHGSKNVALFNTLGAARRFAKSNYLSGVFGKARVVNQLTQAVTDL